MNAYIRVIDTLYDLLSNDASINTVTKGGDIDTNKKNCFPLAHINVLNSEFDKATISFNVAIFTMSLRDLVKDTEKDKWTENDNENENLDDMLYVQHRLYQNLLKLNDELELSSVELLEPFTEAYNNVADGWVMRVKVTLTETDSGIC